MDNADGLVKVFLSLRAKEGAKPQNRIGHTKLPVH